MVVLFYLLLYLASYLIWSCRMCLPARLLSYVLLCLEYRALYFYIVVYLLSNIAHPVANVLDVGESVLNTE